MQWKLMQEEELNVERKLLSCPKKKKNPKKQGKREEISEAERKTSGNEVAFWLFCTLFF